MEEDTRESAILDLKINIYFIYLDKKTGVARTFCESNHVMLNFNKKGKLKLNKIEHISEIRKLILIHSGIGFSA